MFDDLRNIADDQANFGSDSDAELAPLLDKKVQKKKTRSKSGSKNLLGMSAFQRFVISGLLFLLVCMLGILFLMITSSAQLF
ncbi:MAG: hypothetical protein WCK35_22510 [Chloroflexota bacterium]|jgi:hypothetical protein